MKKIHILLVEDNEGDILLTKEALEDAKIVNNLTVAKNGEQAMQILKKEKGYEHIKKPDLILLDINLPKKNGHEVLNEIKQDDKLKSIPVIILTTSSSQKDIIKSYEEYANCYVIKPVEGVDFMNAITKIEQFWISIVKLPENKG